MKSKNESTELIKIPTAKLLKSKALAGYQKDFAKAILTEPEYSLDDAIRTLDKALNKPLKGVN